MSMKKHKQNITALDVPVEKPQWFTIREAADYLSIGEPTLYRWMRDGRITYRKIGDSTRFLQSDLDEVVRVVHRQTALPGDGSHCPACGSSDLEDGVFRSTGMNYFQPQKTKFFTLRDSSVKVKAVMCAQCGAVFLHGDTGKLAKLRKARMEKAAEKELPPGEDINIKLIEDASEDNL